MNNSTSSSSSSGVIFLQRVNDDNVKQSRKLRKNMTPAEAVLWQRIRGGAVNGIKFHRQQVIEGFIVDFFCHAAKLVIEIDGGVHDTAEQKSIDAHRREVFAARGLREIRFRNEEVLDTLEMVIEKIGEACRPHPPHPPLLSERGS